MKSRFKKINWKKVFNLTTWTLILFFVEIVMYQNFFQFKAQQYWMIIPVALYLILIHFRKYLKENYFESISLQIPAFLSLILLFSMI